MPTKSSFIQNLRTKCQHSPGRVIFPEGDDPRVIEAALLLIKWNTVSQVILITTNNSVPSPLTDTRARFISIRDKKSVHDTRLAYQNFLSKKNKTADETTLNEISLNPLYQAGVMLSEDKADCVVAGCVATTADVIRASLATVGLAPGIKTVSGSFIMDRSTELKNETYVYGDCGVVIDPTPEQLTDIASGCCETLNKITGQTPVVAFLSFSTKGSAEHPAAQKLSTAAKLFKERSPNIDSDGELQFDAAFVGEIGNRKAPGSPVPGRANCFIFPDLDAGNIAYKITQRLAGFGAYGPILQGLAKPYSDLSRGASAEDIAISALINILRSR